MKIGFDAKRVYQNYTGLGNYSRDLVRNLLTYYPQHQYFFYAPKVVENERVAFLKTYDNVVIRTPKSSLHKTFKGIWRSIDLDKELTKDGIAIYHGLSNEIPKRVKESKVKHIVTIHDLIFKRFPDTYNAIDRNIYDRKFKYSALNSDKIIAISEQTKQDIISFYNIKADKIEVIYQTCHENFRKQYTLEEKESVRLKYNLPKSFLLNVGTIEKRKNLNALVQAIPLMKNKLPVVVVGRKTKYYDFILEQIKENQIANNRFIFLENVSIQELPIIYQLANIFIYPSVFEGFGIPIIEALFSATPVITTKGGCFAEAGGKHSVYVNTQNYNEVADAIDFVLENKEKQEEMKEKGKAYAKRFLPKILTDKLMRLYQNIYAG